MADDKLLAVGWDLDSTLCSTTHRRHLIPEIRAGRATWDDYSDMCPDDEPIAGAVALARILRAAWHPQYAISGRSERALDMTWEWLKKHDVPIDHVILRPEGDRTENGQWKAQTLNALKHQRGVQFGLFLEDWGPAAKHIALYTSIPVLGVNPFDEGTVMTTETQLADALTAHPAYSNADWVEPRVLAADLFARLGGAFLCQFPCRTKSRSS